MNKTTKIASAFAAFALMLTAISGLAVAGSTGVTGTATVQAPVCAISVNTGSINFGTFYGGETIAPTEATGITVTNESTFVAGQNGNPNVGIQTGLTVSGTNWNGALGGYFGATNTTVLLDSNPTYTSASDTDAYVSPFALPFMNPSGTVINLGANGATAGLLFGLSIPVGQTPDSYTQTITVSTTC